MALIPYIFSYRYSTQRAAVESPHPQRVVTLDRRGRLLNHQESYLSADPLSDWKLWYRAFRWHSERWSHCGDHHLLDPSAQCRVPLAEKSVGMVTMKLSKWIIIQPVDFLIQTTHVDSCKFSQSDIGWFLILRWFKAPDFFNQLTNIGHSCIQDANLRHSSCVINMLKKYDDMLCW